MIFYLIQRSGQVGMHNTAGGAVFGADTEAFAVGTF